MALKLILLFLSFVSILYVSSGDGVANQTCDGTSEANSKFYCPYDGKCKPRSQRCIGANICNNPVTNKEEGCYETSTPGKYQVRLGHAVISSSSSSKRDFYEHRFIEYRGFAYEFGSSYGVQILDTADPKYKYKNGKELNSNGIENIGTSYCTWQDATKYANGWRKNYNLFTNNCQHFADGLKKHLTTGVCNRPLSSYVKHEDRNAELDEQINQILSDCSIVCCYGSNRGIDGINGNESNDSNDQTNVVVGVGVGVGSGIGTVLCSVFLITCGILYCCCTSRD